MDKGNYESLATQQAKGAQMNKTHAEMLEFVRASQEFDDAMKYFLANPTFSSKQKAMDLLLGQLSRNSLSTVHSTGSINV